MYSGKKISVVVPAHNEARQLPLVISRMPEFVDRIVVVDDASTDETIKTVQEISELNAKVILLKPKSCKRQIA